MNEERVKYLWEKMGKCWHEWHNFPTEKFPVCLKCHTSKRFVHARGGLNWEGHVDFSTWPRFGLLWEWAIKRDDWDKFVCFVEEEIITHILIYLVNPDRFANAIYEWLKIKEGR